MGIFIVAPLKGHEFHRACANVGGEFIQISPASPHCINVMEIRKVDRSVNELLDGPGIQLLNWRQKSSICTSFSACSFPI